MSKNQVKKIIKEYISILKDNGWPVKSAYLFGSWTNNTAGKWSDIDVAIVINKNLNFWERKKQASRLSVVIDSRLEPHIFTAKDFKNLSDPMVHEIRKTGEKVV